MSTRSGPVSPASSQPRCVRRRVALDQCCEFVEFEALKRVGLLTTLRYAVAQLEDHVALAVPLLFNQSTNR